MTRLLIGLLLAAGNLFAHAEWAVAQCRFVETDKLLAASGAERDEFGTSVAMSGDTAIVGAPYDDDRGDGAGAAYIFESVGGVWSQTTKLTGDGSGAGSRFGGSVAISGDTAVIGAHGEPHATWRGAAYVFERIDGAWTQVARLVDADGGRSDFFGRSVSVYGELVVIGASQARGRVGNTGAAFVFGKVEGKWTEVAKLAAGDGESYNNFGYSVSLSGDVILVGAPHAAGSHPLSGAVYVFEAVGTEWKQRQKIQGFGSGGALLGASVALDGDRAIVSAPRHAGGTGALCIFERDAGGAWTIAAFLVAPDGKPGDFLGDRVALSGDMAVAGARGADGREVGAGAAYVFERAGSSWAEVARVVAWDGGSGDRFGLAVATDGAVAMIGAPRHDAPERDMGSVYVFGADCSCYADCDGSGSLDFSDFLCFQALFAAGSPDADCDASLELDFFDFLCFQNKFAAGCP